uniref:Uncharacterized protein n=1 Tax=Rhizophora mucronata TaxID=61149 RepID=A0A2P2N2K1_RHIMU
MKSSFLFDMYFKLPTSDAEHSSRTTGRFTPLQQKTQQKIRAKMERCL